MSRNASNEKLLAVGVGDQGILGTGSAITLVAAVMFALNTPFAALFYSYGGDPLTVMTARTAVGGFAVLAICLVLRLPLGLTRKQAKLIGIIVVGQFFQGACYLGSVAFIPVSLAALIFFTWPIMVALAAPMAGDPRPSAKAFLLFGTAFAGLALALGPALDSLDWRGIALAVVGGLGVTVYVTLGRTALRELPALPLAAYMNLGTMMLSIIAWGLLSGNIDWIRDPKAGDATAILLTVCVVYSLGILMQLWALRRASAPVVALVFNLEPVLSIAAAAILLGETLTVGQMLGGAIVIASLIAFSLLGTTAKRHDATQPPR